MSLSKFKSIKEMFMLNGRKAIVTGAGGGIGRAIAYALAGLGADVALFDLDSEKIADLKEILERRFPVKVLAMRVDVCNRDQVEEAVNLVLKNFGQIDVLVNSHGIGQWVSFENMTDEDWNKMINVNLTGVFIMCQVVGRHMIGRGSGKIINIASMSGRIVNRPQPQAHYNASKAGVIMLTKSLAAEWAKYGVNVNCVSPGYTLTPLVENLLKCQPEYADQWRALIPLGRFAEPADIVGAVIFLASGAADYITGHDLVVDGGYTIW